MVQVLLDKLTSRGILEAVRLESSTVDLTKPAAIAVHRFLYQERAYVQYLEKLNEMADEIRSPEATPHDPLYREAILSIAPLLSAQRKFLLRAEMTALEPAECQSWRPIFQALFESAMRYYAVLEDGLKSVIGRKQRYGQTVKQKLYADTLFFLTQPQRQLEAYRVFLEVRLP